MNIVQTFATVCMLGITAGGCASQELTMLVGTYTPGSSKGIYSFRFNEENGTATPLSEVKVGNPSYLAPSADGRFVYAVSEFNDERASVHSLAFDKEKGTFQLLNSQPTNGGDPCYIITNETSVVTANYSGGSISVLPIAKDGTLLPATQLLEFEGTGIDSTRQEKPHLHCVCITPDGKYLLANDLGTDHIYRYVIHTNGTPLLEEGQPSAYQLEAGSGPRHLTFAANGRYAYLINELAGTVVAFEYADGNLKEIQSIAADTVGARGSADIHVSPDGKFLYASNRLKADGVAIFSIHSENGKLTKVGYQQTGIHPRNFNITPGGKYLLAACRDSNVIEVYERDARTGLLTNTHKDIKVDMPVCIRFVR